MSSQYVLERRVPVMKQKLLPLLTACWLNDNSGSMEPCTYSQAQVPGQPVRICHHARPQIPCSPCLNHLDVSSGRDSFATGTLAMILQPPRLPCNLE